EEAMVSSIQLELRMQRAAGHKQVLVVPGNYGRAFAAGVLGLDVTDAVTCSNYIGATIDEAARLGFARMLLVGSLGKLVKVAAGVMNTHSRVADCRAEVMAAHAALAGAGLQVVADIMDAPTTDAILEILQAQELQQQVADSIMERIALHLSQRAGKNMQVEAIVFSNRYGLIGATAQAGEMLSCGNAIEDAWIGGPSPSPRCGEDDAG
ncbi:MAG: cobalt-precorrin-5B (C(1))-methyltransferase, partial [Atopobiaceae bacterium]|nr:cobalt-precorrin-5B (C(1))-methyltransferase [Atopobiaceae bacterium]